MKVLPQLDSASVSSRLVVLNHHLSGLLVPLFPDFLTRSFPADCLLHPLPQGIDPERVGAVEIDARVPWNLVGEL